MIPVIFCNCFLLCLIFFGISLFPHTVLFKELKIVSTFPHVRLFLFYIIFLCYCFRVLDSSFLFSVVILCSYDFMYLHFVHSPIFQFQLLICLFVCFLVRAQIQFVSIASLYIIFKFFFMYCMFWSSCSLIL